MNTDLWHYPRATLAKQVLGMFDSGLSTSLIFFAPRRMGKTEFLRKDVQPLAEKNGWHTLYFSFLDVGDHADHLFSVALTDFLRKGRVANLAKGLTKRVKKISGSVGEIRAAIELTHAEDLRLSLKLVMEKLSKRGKTLLLLDEIQVLAKHTHNEQFIATLRTALDMYKDQIKVIFTGSSQAGLRKMFSQKCAPFFHFGQNLPFPKLGQDFTIHLASAFAKVTNRQLNQEELWISFQILDQVPQLIRSLVERLVLHPSLTMKEGTEQILLELSENRSYVQTWEDCSKLQRSILLFIALERKTLFGKESRDKIAKQLGEKMIKITSVQSAVRGLLKKELVGSSSERGAYYIDDPNFRKWLISNMEDTYQVQLCS